MATTTATITLSSTDLLTDSLSLTSTQTLYNNPDFCNGLARKKITSTAIGTTSGQVILYTADDMTPGTTAYIYIKNLSTTSTDYVFVYTGSANILKMAGGDWALLPWNASDNSLSAWAVTNPTSVEFMVIGTE